MAEESGFQVALVDQTSQPMKLAYVALHNDYSETFEPEAPFAEDKCGQVVVDRLLAGGRGHWGPLEHASLSLLIRADHPTIMQLRTHRLASFDVQSMRYTGKRIEEVARLERPVEDVFYCRPPGLYRDRKGAKYDFTEADREEFLAICLSSAIDYLRMRDNGMSEEHARGVLVNSYYQNALVTANLRSWLHILDMRLKADAQLEIRMVMDMVAEHVKDWAPAVYEYWQSHRKGKALLAP